MSYRTVTIDGWHVNLTTTAGPKGEGASLRVEVFGARTEMTVEPGRSEFQKLVRFVRLDKVPS